MKYCKNCGAQMEDDFLFCTYCGYTEKNNVPEVKPNAVDGYETEKSKAGQQTDAIVRYTNEKTAGKNASRTSGKRIKPAVIVAAAAGGVLICIIAVCILSAAINSSNRSVPVTSSKQYASIPDP